MNDSRADCHSFTERAVSEYKLLYQHDPQRLIRNIFKFLYALAEKATVGAAIDK